MCVYTKYSQSDVVQSTIKLSDLVYQKFKVGLALYKAQAFGFGLAHCSILELSLNKDPCSGQDSNFQQDFMKNKKKLLAIYAIENDMTKPAMRIRNDFMRIRTGSSKFGQCGSGSHRIRLRILDNKNKITKFFKKYSFYFFII